MKYPEHYEEYIKVVANNIKELRKARGLTQEDMMKFGFSVRHYKRIESGKYKFTLYNVYKLARVLKVRVEKIVPSPWV
jgi:transcriptional regulator with XRE-family HTH domain